MPGPLLYRPPPRWQFYAALGGAVFLHIAAIGIAAINREPAVVDLSSIPTATVEAMLQPEDQPTPPPEDIPIPEPPPIPEVAPEFHEEKPPPPRPQTKPTGPIKAPQGVTGTMSITGAKAVAIFAPKPDYPYEARSRHVTGSGVAILTVDVPSGNVTDASMAQSIGSPILDNSTTSTFRRWRFRPGAAAPKVKVPITYTMSGASY
ncbi:MAG TPA: energy transducer TonB [Chthoniobacterales bacterium]|nr:energy transducer TonB [Chthoniobacterales bacterium]